MPVPRLHLTLASSSLLASAVCLAQAPRLPAAFTLSQNGTRLTRAQTAAGQRGLYRLDTVRTLAVAFDTDDWFAGVNAGTLPATVVFDGDTLAGVGVRVKGSSTDRTNLTLKKSFAFDLDAAVDGQDLSGYDALNLHSGIYDQSHVREALFYWIGGHYMPVPLSNFVHLTVNGQSWGAYTNTQQQDRDFVREWFADDAGPRWRGTAPTQFAVTNPDSACGERFPGGRAASLSALTYLGDEPGDYARHYTPKGDHARGDDLKLAGFIAALHGIPDAQLRDSLPRYLDVDAALWLLAHEIALTDEDGYVYKTHSDFLLYHEPAAARVTPLEYDGNGALQRRHGAWGPLHRADDPCLPLLSRLLSVPEWRQRYLAHFRTIVEEYLDPAVSLPVADSLVALIDGFEADDPIGDSLYTYQQFRGGRDLLAETLRERYAFLASHPLLTPRGPELSQLAHAVNGEPWASPNAGERPLVTVAAADAPAAVRLYHATGLTEPFARVAMRDDGTGGDERAGDGVYSAQLPPRPAGVRVRYYVEGVAGDEAGTVAYLPARAEADVRTYVVARERSPASGTLVINELVAGNGPGGAVDEAGDTDDWLELYNPGTEPVELAGYYLSDDDAAPRKWAFPVDAVVAPGQYQIVWCDGDAPQGPFHASFKLDRDGESVTLGDARGRVVDHVAYGELPRDTAYARQPNGTGDFARAAPTFGRANGGGGGPSSIAAPGAPAFSITCWPNPATDDFTIRLETGAASALVFDARGRLVARRPPAPEHHFSVVDWPDGIFTAVLTDPTGNTGPRARRVVVARR